SGVHVICVLLSRLRAHAAADDIQKSEDACFGAIDDAVFEVGKILVTGAAGISDGGDATAEGEAVGIKRVVAVVAVPQASSGIDVSVNINKTGSDVKTLGVDGLSSVRSGNVFSDGSNFVVANGDIADFVNVVFWVEDRSVLDEEVVFFLSEEWRRKKQEEKKT